MCTRPGQRWRDGGSNPAAPIFVCGEICQGALSLPESGRGACRVSGCERRAPDAGSCWRAFRSPVAAVNSRGVRAVRAAEGSRPAGGRRVRRRPQQPRRAAVPRSLPIAATPLRSSSRTSGPERARADAFHAALRRAASRWPSADRRLRRLTRRERSVHRRILRQRLQQRFGEAGPGFVVPGKPWPLLPPRRRSTMEESRGLRASASARRAPEDGDLRPRRRRARRAHRQALDRRDRRRARTAG